MPGYLLLYHPAVAKLKELIDAGELGDVLYLYGNRQNLGQIRRDENALWSLGAHDLSVMLHLVGEEPVEAWARGESFLREGIEDVVFCYLRFPSGVVAHMHRLLARPAQDAQADRRRARQDGRLRRHGARAQADGATTRARCCGRRREWQVRDGRHPHPEARERGAAPARVRALPLARRAASGDRSRPAREGLAVVRALELLQELAGPGTAA